MKHFFTILLFFFQQTFAQQQIHGIALNSSNSSKLIAASVFINTSTIGTITGEDGKFFLGGITATNFQLIISYVGFTPLVLDSAIPQRRKLIMLT